MTRKRDLAAMGERFRSLLFPKALPPQPWRYTITPTLVHSLTQVADAAGQMRAAPLSYYRQKELAAQAKRRRIQWNASGPSRRVKPEEVEAVLRGARLADHRRWTGEAIARAALVEDALAHYTSFSTREPRLTPETAMAYLLCSGSKLPGLEPPARTTLRTAPNWKLFSSRERGKLLELQRTSSPVPSEVRAIFDWAGQDPLVSDSAVLRTGTIYWAMKKLIPSWQSVSVLLHHELRVSGIDSNGLLMLVEAPETWRDLLEPASYQTVGAEEGDLTTVFESFSSALRAALVEVLERLGRLQDNESHLPWRIVAPPDELDARLIEVIERLGQGGSAQIQEALGDDVPPLRTLQRRLQKLVGEGVLSKRGARKNATYAVADGGTE